MTDAPPIPPPPSPRTTAELKQLAKGQWANILEDLAPDNALGAAYAANGFHVSCPVHGGFNGFRLFNDFNDTGGTVCNTCRAHPDGLSTLSWLLEREFGAHAYREATHRVAAWLNVDQGQRQQTERVPLVFKPLVDPERAAAKIAEVWRASLPLKGSVAEKYLLSRGIYFEHLPRTLRFHPGLRYWDARAKRELGTFPCLLAPIKDKENKIISIHRIFLDSNGAKAPVPDPKKMMAMCGEMRGTAIKLFEAGETLGVAEGIETALAAHAISRMPVWSCVSAPLLENVDIPDIVKTLVIWTDKDRSERGTEAANKLADRAEREGKRVEICTPVQPIPADAKGIDWLDVLLLYGIPGFPPKWRRWRECTR